MVQAKCMRVNIEDKKDVYERLQPDDLKQIAVIVASFVYDAAMRDQMLPRKPIEKPLPREPEKKEDQ